MTKPNFRALCAELIEWLILSETPPWEVIDQARTALATPPPLAPDYIDPEHHGEDRELLQVFYAACFAEGGTADEIHLRGIRAVMAARTALATPPPEPPTDEELLAMRSWSSHSHTFDSDLVDFAIAVLERWGK